MDNIDTIMLLIPTDLQDPVAYMDLPALQAPCQPGPWGQPQDLDR